MRAKNKFVERFSQRQGARTQVLATRKQAVLSTLTQSEASWEARGERMGEELRALEEQASELKVPTS